MVLSKRFLQRGPGLKKRAFLGRLYLFTLESHSLDVKTARCFTKTLRRLSATAVTYVRLNIYVYGNRDLRHKFKQKQGAVMTNPMTQVFNNN